MTGLLRQPQLVDPHDITPARSVTGHQEQADKAGAQCQRPCERDSAPGERLGNALAVPTRERHSACGCHERQQHGY